VRRPTGWRPSTWPVVSARTSSSWTCAFDRPPAVLVVTTFDLDEYVFEALRAGACGFLLKDAGEE
jgi:DNA-binding NarL/FixJ family response regulator